MVGKGGVLWWGKGRDMGVKRGRIMVGRGGGLWWEKGVGFRGGLWVGKGGELRVGKGGRLWV